MLLSYPSLTPDLIHSPLVPEDLQKAWAQMEAIKKDGLALSVGVSNFREEDILEISKTWTHAPAVNQVGAKKSHCWVLALYAS